MLVLGSQLIGTPIMGLQTGTELARAASPLIDPADLKIIAYTVEGSLLDEHPSFIRIADIRELSDIGMIVDSSDEFIGLHDVIKIEELHKLNFKLIGMTIVDEHKHKLGKVEDYSIDSGSFIVQQLTVKQGVIKGLTSTGLLIHRSQITAINNNSIVVRSGVKPPEPVMHAQRRTYVNPFRGASPQPENSDI